MGHRPGRGQTGQPGAGRCRGADAATDDRRVVEDVGDVRVDMPGTEADDRLRRRRVHAQAGGTRPAGRLGEHPQERGLVQPEPAVAGADPEDDLLGFDGVAVGQRLEPRLVGVGSGQDVAEQVARLVDAAQDPRLAGEDLHDHERVPAFLGEDALGAREVHIGRVAREDLVRRPRAREAHQSGRTPVAPASPGSSGPPESGGAPSVAYGSATSTGLRTVGASCGSTGRRVHAHVPAGSTRHGRAAAAPRSAAPPRRAPESTRRRRPAGRAPRTPGRSRGARPRPRWPHSSAARGRPPPPRTRSTRRTRRPSPTRQVAAGEQGPGQREIRLRCRLPQADGLEQVRRDGSCGGRGL